MARDTRRCIDDARDVMAEALGSEPGEIVFTGGGTEGDNMAVVGRHMRAGGVTVCSAIEHPCGAGAGRALGRPGGGGGRLRG